MGTEQVLQLSIPDQGPLLAGVFASIFLGILLYTAINAGVYVKRIRKLKLAKDLIDEGHEKIMQDEAYRGTNDTSQTIDYYTEENGQEIKFTGQRVKEDKRKKNKKVRLSLNKNARKETDEDIEAVKYKKALDDAGIDFFSEDE